MSGQYPNGNTAIGDSALKSATSNLATIGHDNTAHGYHALKTLEGGRNESTAVGAFSLKGNITGENTAVGAFSASNGDGTENTAVGNWALRYGAGGSSNTAVGFRALAGDENSNADPITKPTGNRNTAIGAHTLRYSADSNENTAIGYNSLNMIDGDPADGNTAVGANSLMNLTTGDNNTVVGRNTGSVITTGSRNTLLGSDTDVSDSSSQFRTVVGSGASSTQDNTVILGRTTDDRVGIRTTAPDAILNIVGDSDTTTAHLVSGQNQPALYVEGGQKWKVATFSTPNTGPIYTADLSDHVIIYNGNSIGPPAQVYLPHPAGLDGQVYVVKNAGFDGLTITLLALSGGRFYDSFASGDVAAVVLSTPGISPARHGVTVIAKGGFYYVISSEYV